MKDDVLRCMAFVKDSAAGFNGCIVDTIDAGDHYALVFEWARFPGRDGEFPKRSVSIHKLLFEQSPSLSSGYELVLKQPLDLTQIKFTDVEASADDIDDSQFRSPRPNDDNPS